jgi:hypothetical protein
MGICSTILLTAGEVPMFKDVLKAIYYYEEDCKAGVQFWRDKRLITLVVSTICVVLARYAGVDIDPDLQASIVGVATGISMLVHPGTGVKAKHKSGDPEGLGGEKG